MFTLVRLLLIVCSTLLLPTGLFAQGGEGRSDTAASRIASTGRYVRRAPKPNRRIASPKEALPVIETGRLSIVVNGGGSRVFLSKTSGDSNFEFTTSVSNAPSLIVRTLPAGSYKLLVKKPGYFDETQVVDILPDKRRKVVVNMRPQMALLTVNTNLKDAEIDINSVGKFTGSVKKYFVKPGLYTVAVQRRGFVPQTTTVDLKLAGREQNISMVLQPLPIDSIIASATEKLFGGDLETAAALTNDILLLNPLHAKANLLFGQISYHYGDLASSSFFLKAIKNNETLRLPVKILEGNAKLIDVELRLDRDGLSLKSKERVDLNFTIARSDISELRRSIESVSMPYIVVKGKSDFYGRPIKPNLTIYSPLAALQDDPPAVYCTAAATGFGSDRFCTTDIDILFKVITDWLDMKDQ